MSYINIKDFEIIASINKQLKFAKTGTTPWNNEEELEEMIPLINNAPVGKKNVVIIGRNTFECIPKEKLQKLNIWLVVLSKTQSDITGADAIFKSLHDALNWVSHGTSASLINDIFVAGGVDLCNEAAIHPCCKRAQIRILDDSYECDREFTNAKYIVSGDARDPQAARDPCRNIIWMNSGVKVFGYNYYFRVHGAEDAYLECLHNVVEYGVYKPNRTNIGTYSKFAVQLRYPLVDIYGKNTLPLLTTKRVSFKLVYSELLWLISGGTTTDFMVKNKNHIWDANASREFLDKQGLENYRAGELGPVYGFQWRYLGAEYMTEKELQDLKHTDEDRRELYQGTGIDQLQNVIDGLRNDPYSRRHIVTAWNPKQLSEMALPPCHHTFTFYVEPGATAESPKLLSCHLEMRSNDMFLGHPFNVASYATLTHMIALIVGMQAKELAITSVDCHVYENHVNQVNIQTRRHPRGFPRIKFSDRVLELQKKSELTIDDFQMSDIEPVDYYSCESIRAEMAV